MTGDSPRSDQGRIRFAGGPLHNQLLTVNAYIPELIIVAPDPQQALQDGHMEPSQLWRHHYRLVRMSNESGTQWLEYHKE